MSLFELVMYRRTLKARGSLEAGSRIPGSRITFGIQGTRKEIETLKSKHVEKRYPHLGWCQSFEVEQVRT